MTNHKNNNHSKIGKHTPGPWTVDKSLNQKHGTRVNAIAPVAWCGTNSSFGVDASQSISAKQARANAHLIAAAPELLEILEDRYQETKCGCEHPACRRCQADARTLTIIQKAKGK